MPLLKPSVLRFKFEDFVNLPSKPGDRVYSEPITDCHGNDWKIFVQPGGTLGGVGEDPLVDIYLKHLGEGSVVARFSFILRDSLGKVVYERCFKQHCFEAMDNWGCSNFLKRSTILDEDNDIIVGGALLVDVHLQFKPEAKPPTAPPGPHSKKMLRLLESGDGADVSFRVGGSTIDAHKLILRMNAPVLFDFCEENDGGSPVPVAGTTPGVFRILLRHAYGEEVPDAKAMTHQGKEIIDAANKFGLTDLKVLVETALVESLALDVDNVAGWLVFADAKTCPLLKEQAMAYFVSRSEDVLTSDASATLKESPKLLTELMLEVSKSASKDSRLDADRTASVSDLRESLQDKGLDVDGSKEILSSRLQESISGQGME